MSTRFVVFTRGRTGSTLICDTLDKLSSVCCGQELFRPESIKLLDNVKSRVSSGEGADELLKHEWLVDDLAQGPVLCQEVMKLVEGNMGHAEYFNYLENSLPDSAAYGFKVLGNHLGANIDEIEKGLESLSRISVKVLFLQRRDVIREAFSLAIAGARQIYNVKKDEDKKRERLNEKIRIDPQVVMNECAYIEHFRAQMGEVFQRVGILYQTVYMEDFLENKKRFLLDQLEFLQISEGEDILSRSNYEDEDYVKVTPDSLSDLVVNYDEIMELLER